MAGDVHGVGVCGRGREWQGGHESWGHVRQGMCMAGECVWQEATVIEGACMAGAGCAWQERWPLQRMVHILLECIGVFPKCFTEFAEFRDKNICHYSKRARTCHFLCERPGCCHSASETCVRDRIFKLSPIHASVIYQIP